MKQSIALVTDSTIDMGQAHTSYDFVRIVPLNVTFPDGTVIRDGVDMTNEAFYAKMAEVNELPVTSQPSPQQFFEVYEEVLAQYDHVISLHISEMLSGTINSANLAYNMLNEADQQRLHIIDSRSVSAAFGMTYLLGAEAIEAGKNLDEVIEIIENDLAKRTCLFTVRTLDNLRKGGRISHLSALFGGMLQIKPILEVGCHTEGKLISINKVRGRKKAIYEIISESKKRASSISEQRICVLNSMMDNPEELDAYIARVKEELNPREIIITEVGSTVGTHTGLGAFAIVFCED